jgi:hypothetical protein
MKDVINKKFWYVNVSYKSSHLNSLYFFFLFYISFLNDMILYEVQESIPIQIDKH